MDASLEPPTLSYPQLFSFQLSYTSRSDHRNSIIPEGSKKGEWRYGILEIDFAMETFFLQDRDRIFMSQTFSSFSKHAEVNGSDDCSLSLIFNSDQWEVAAQNIAEKVCLQHILECIANNLAIENVVRNGREKGIVGLDKNIIKHGRVQRKAINQKRLDDRYLVLCPGKLFVFKTFDVKGKHVRYVTSLLGATIRMLPEEREFQILAPGSKTITLIPETQEDLTSWVEALAISIGHTKQGDEGSEANMKDEEKKTNVQRTSGCSDQCATVLHDECGAASRLPQQPQTTGEIGPFGAETRPPELASLNRMTKSQIRWDVGESLQEVDCTTTPLLKQAFRKEDKENRDANRPCTGGKGSTNRPSRAMVYLENALDEMEVIVGSIRTTRRLGGVSHFDTFDNRRIKKGGVSPLRSSWDFDWKKQEGQSWKGKGAYMDAKWREREPFVNLGQATKARCNVEVPKLNVWKQRALQSNKDWSSDRNRGRELETLQLRHSVDGLSNVIRNRDLPGQDQALGRISYSGRVLPSAGGRSSAASAQTPSKVQISPASENLLKRYSGEVSETEMSSLSRSLQIGSLSGMRSRDAATPDTRQQAITQQQQRMAESSTYPYVPTTPSTSEDEEDEEEDDIEEDGVGSENYSGSTAMQASTANSRESAMLDGFKSSQDGDNANLWHHSQSGGGRPSAEGAYMGSLCMSQQDETLPSTHYNQAWQGITNRDTAQQSLRCSTSNRFFGASDPYNEAKPSKYSDVPLEPTTPKVREESQSNQTFVSCLKARDRNTLHDPIYDPEFTGPQLINRRQNRLSQDGYNGNADVRKSIDNVRFHSTQAAPSFVDAKEPSSKLSRNQLLSNVPGDETESFQRGLPIDHGLSHVNELPELVNRISKITAAFDNRDREPYHTSDKGGATDVMNPGHSGAAAYDMQIAGEDPTAGPYQRAGMGSSLRGTRHSMKSIDSSNLNGVEGHLRWSSAEMLTPSRDAYHSSNRQSKA